MSFEAFQNEELYIPDENIKLKRKLGHDALYGYNDKI